MWHDCAWYIDTFCIRRVADPPRITIHAQSLEDAIQGKSANFSVHATGTHPLNYQWYWKPSKKGSGSEELQPCDAEWSDGPTLTIPSVQKSNEGCYCCKISNCAGSLASNPVKLCIGKNLTIVLLECEVSLPHPTFCFDVAKPPRITTHPQA